MPNAIVFKAEVGDDVRRRRSTVRVTQIQMSFILTRDQIPVFSDFYRNELNDGILSFRMPSRVSLDDMTVRFDLSNQPYSIQPLSARHWTLAVSLKRIER